MEHPLALRLAASIAALTLAACGGSTPTPALTSALPSLEATPAATATAEPTIAVTATPLLEPTGRILFSAVPTTASLASIYVMNADGSGVTKLTGTAGGNAPAWSPDGTMIAFVRTGIWVMHADGSQARPIRDDPTTVDQWPVWSPDGRLVAFVESRVCAPCGVGMTSAIDVMNADGSGLHKIADTLNPDRPAWSPDGQSIVFAGRLDDPPTAANGLQSIRLDGSGLHQVTTGPDSSPAFSSDGRLAFLRGATTAADGTIVFSLFIANADGSAPHEVKLSIVAEPPLAWAPGGGWIALAGATTLPILKAGQWDIWIIRPDGTGLLNVTNTTDRGEGFPAWH
jgi:Tol biopolymer transport system component